MTVLSLGVLDVAYSDGKKTTGDAAEIIEAKYHVMEIFAEEHLQDIAGILEETIGDALEDLISGAPVGGNSLAAATGQIEHLFNKFIDTKEMDGLGYPGVPTQAALNGVNHRMKHPTAKRSPRPSFKDTGLYEQSFRAEIES